MEEQIEEFFNWYEGRDIVPRIQSIKEEAAADVEARLTKEAAASAGGGEGA